MKKLLILGANSQLARQFVNRLQNNNDWQPISIGRKEMGDATHLKTVEKFFDEYFAKIRPDFVINFVSLASPEICEKKPALSEKINYEFPCLLERIAKRYFIPIVHFSSVLVFGDTIGLKDNSSQIDPINVYGKHKAMLEKKVQLESFNGIILRLSPLFGFMHQYESRSTIDLLIRELMSGNTVRAVSDALISPLYVDDLINLLLRMIRNDFRGIATIGGNEHHSIASLLEELSNLNQFSSANISTDTLDKFNLNARRPLDLRVASKSIWDMFNLQPEKISAINLSK